MRNAIGEDMVIWVEFEGKHDKAEYIIVFVAYMTVEDERAANEYWAKYKIFKKFERV